VTYARAAAVPAAAARLLIGTAFHHLRASRLFAGNEYVRESNVFGDREPVTVAARLLDALGLPVINVDVDVYLDGRKVATVKTDWGGNLSYTFERGLPKGDHEVKLRFNGDWLHDPCEASISVKSVGMVESYFKAYVESLTASPSDVEAKLMDRLLSDDVGAVAVRVEADPARIRYVFTMLVPEEDTRGQAGQAQLGFWAVVFLVALAIGFALAAAAALVYVVFAYVVGQYQCGACGQRFTTCEALKMHVMSAHPDVWEKIKDRFECAPPVGPLDWLKWVAVGVVGAVGLILLVELVRAVRR
jgi:hypothetical protein